MTTIETVYAVLAALLTEFGDKRGYKVSSDPFTFDSASRGATSTRGTSIRRSPRRPA